MLIWVIFNTNEIITHEPFSVHPAAFPWVIIDLIFIYKFSGLECHTHAPTIKIQHLKIKTILSCQLFLNSPWSAQGILLHFYYLSSLLKVFNMNTWRIFPNASDEVKWSSGFPLVNSMTYNDWFLKHINQYYLVGIHLNHDNFYFINLMHLSIILYIPFEFNSSRVTNLTAGRFQVSHLFSVLSQICTSRRECPDLPALLLGGFQTWYTSVTSTNTWTVTPTSIPTHHKMQASPPSLTLPFVD